MKKLPEPLCIAETLLGISCLLSTVYQSLYLHPGPGLTGESTGALNEMDKWKLGEQTAATAAQNLPFSVMVRALSAVARCCSRTSVPVLGSAREWGTQEETAEQRGSLSTRTSAPSRWRQHITPNFCLLNPPIKVRQLWQDSQLGVVWEIVSISLLGFFLSRLRNIFWIDVAESLTSPYQE